MIPRLPLAPIAALLLGLWPGSASQAGDARSFERDGDRYLKRREYRLARENYRAAIQRSPYTDELWTKYDQASERYFAVVFGKPGRPVGGPPGDGEEEPPGASPAAEASPPSPGSGEPPSPADAEPSPQVSPAEPAPEPSPTKAAAQTYSPGELIYLDQTLRADAATPVPVLEEGGTPVVIRSVAYELTDIKFQVDTNFTLHCTGRAKNVSQRDMRNTKAFVEIFDKNQAQVGQGVAYVGVDPIIKGSAPIIFPGEERDFDVAIPGFNSTVGAFRIRLSH